MAQKEIAEVRLVGSYDGQTFVNVWHFQQKVDDTGELADILTTFKNVVADDYRGCIVADAEIQYLEARFLTPEPTDPVISAITTGTGTATGEGMPSFCSVVMGVRTGFSARTKRGRWYMPAVPEEFADGGTLTAAAITEYNQLANEMLAAYNDDAGEDWNFGVWSRKLAGEMPYDIAAFTEATSINVNNILGTQRRRRIGHGS